MNPVMKYLWKWQAKRKLTSQDISLRYASIYLLGELGKPKDFELLLDGLKNHSQIIRNVTSLALKKIHQRYQDKPEISDDLERQVIDLFSQSNSLIEKLAHIEVMETFQLSVREDLLSPLVIESENDLQYALIRSLADTRDQELLDAVLKASDTNDLVLRKTALETWHKGISTQDFDEILSYCTPRIHFLIRATYELQTDGNFLRKVLSFSNLDDFPTAKAYPDAIIRYLTELLGNWEFDPEAYRSLHAIVVPSYFTFDDDDKAEGERPFVIL